MPNRLADEKSPYLLQHAENPVDWYPWGEEAFARARAEDKPIFLSVGYSTCHWCHVMEHESFEQPAVAEVLNQSFVSIKVDREERPDVDRVYMTFVQATTGAGGWPMSVWLTPELKPFYGGTYFPPESRYNRPGFVEVLQAVARAWRDERERIELSATELVRRMREAATARAGRRAPPPAPDVLARGVASFAQAYDARHGGFGGAPKFPRPSELLFLLREHARTQRAGAARPGAARACARWRWAACAITSAAASTATRWTSAWRVPHFEKMLYDQAQLVLAYLEAAQATGDRFFAQVADDTLQYVGRELTASRRRLLLGGRRRQPAGRSAAWRPQGRRRVLRVERRRTRGTCSATTPTSSRRGSASRRAATRRSIRTASSPARTCSTRRRSVDDIVATAGTAGGARWSTPRPRAPGAVCRAARPAAAAPGRQGAVRVERPDDCGVRPRRARAARAPASACEDTAAAHLATAQRAATFRARRSCGTSDRQVLLRRFRDGDAARRRLRRGLRGDGLRPARAVPGRRQPANGSSGRTSCRRSSTRASTTRSTAGGSARRVRTRPC